MRIMVKRPGGELSGSTRKLKRERKLTPADFVREFAIGEKVAIDPKPYYKDGKIPHLRYRGRVGVIKEKRGRSYVVEIKDGGKIKKIVALPIFLRKVT